MFILQSFSQSALLQVQGSITKKELPSTLFEVMTNHNKITPCRSELLSYEQTMQMRVQHNYSLLGILNTIERLRLAFMANVTFIFMFPQNEKHVCENGAK